MPWCPVCKNEYQEGVTHCADCGAKLVESLKNRKEVLLASGEEKLMTRMKKFMEYNDIPVIFEEEDENISLYVLPKYQEKARSAAFVFLSGEEAEDINEEDFNEADSDEANYIEEEIQNDITEETGKLRRMSPTGVYETKKDKAGEMNSSGILLLAVGLIGMITVILADCNVIPISIGNKVVVSVIMLIFFVFFAAFGIYCIRDAAKMKAESSEEEKVTKEISEWIKKTLTAERIDSEIKKQDGDLMENLSMESLSTESLSVEVLYFKRTACMREMLANQFPDADDLLIESLIEESYQELFE